MFFCTTALFFLVVQMSYAEKWQAVGARAMAMGGAGVASATGSAQQYYNPALFYYFFAFSLIYYTEFL